jgi:hypothetical protein
MFIVEKLMAKVGLQIALSLMYDSRLWCQRKMFGVNGLTH